MFPTEKGYNLGETMKSQKWEPNSKMAGDEESSCSFQWDDESKLYFHAGCAVVDSTTILMPDGTTAAGTAFTILSKTEITSLWNPTRRMMGLKITIWQGHPPCSLVTQQWKAALSWSTVMVLKIFHNQHLNVETKCFRLEETLINLYLMGYPNKENNTDEVLKASVANVEGSDEVIESRGDESNSEAASTCNHDSQSKHIEGSGQEPVTAGMVNALDQRDEIVTSVDDSWYEEVWHSQYGQTLQSGDEQLLPFPVIDLWDWSRIIESGRKQVTRIVGRLVRRSSKLHQSLPSGGGLLKTASVCEVSQDLVKVTSGKVYRLRSPSSGYLATLPIYDASNPTKDWGFPDFALDKAPPSSSKIGTPAISDSLHYSKGSSSTYCQQKPAMVKDNYPEYRDRAAERRALYGGFGIGPGQNLLDEDNIDEAATLSEAEALNFSFGPGSYARRILERMGWKEGDTLGRTSKGLLEPLQAEGNKSGAGLGWNTS